jgi:hypothetical protein
VIDTLKELDFSEAQTLKILYQYKKLSKHENQDVANDVAKEYKSGMQDPSRVAA